MFAKFKLELTRANRIMLERNFRRNYASCSSRRDEIINNKIFDKIVDKISEYWLSDGSFDAKAIENDWFPEIDAQVFISHSSHDEKWATFLATWLSKEYGIRSFVDSAVWGYANDLLKVIDDECCSKQKGVPIYNYEKRNQSTAHIHMILQGALATMINKCECFIFLQTPNSIKTALVGQEDKTASPWIYNELLMAKLLPRMKPQRLGMIVENTKFASSALFSYPAPLDDLKALTITDIMAAGIRAGKKDVELLNQLYKDKGLIGVSNG